MWPPDCVNTAVAGLRYAGRGTLLPSLRPGDPLRLQREPDNAADRQAVRILTADGADLGYLPRHVARWLGPRLDSGQIYSAVVAFVCPEATRHRDRLTIVFKRWDGPDPGRSLELAVSGVKLWESCPPWELTSVVVDLETTGLSPDHDEIIEIAAVRIENGRVVGNFDTLIKPRRPIPAFITGLTGINNSMVGGKPPLQEVLPDFLDFSSESVLVAHNASFDIGFLRSAAWRHLGRDFEPAHLCTCRLSRLLIPGLRSYGLDSVSSHLTLRVCSRHRAMSDVTLTLQVWMALLDNMRLAGVNSIGDLRRRLGYR